MLEYGPSGTDGEKFCPFSAAFQGPRPNLGLPCVGRFAWEAGKGAIGARGFSPAWPLRPLVTQGVRGRAFGLSPPSLPRQRAACCLCRPAPCWQGPGRTAGAWGRSPRAAGSPQLLAPQKMTICHSIKVSGQLMGEPGSATSGQNGLLPRIGEVQMLNAEHCALSQSRPPPGLRFGRWTAAG